MPLIPNGEELNLEYFGDSKYSFIFLNTCELAERCADFYKHPVYVVIHCGLSLDILYKMLDSFRKIEEIFRLAMRYCPNIEFSLENSTPYRVTGKDVYFRQPAFAENVELAQHFNKVLDTNKFSTTFDICHYLMTDEMLCFLMNDSACRDIDKPLDWFFEQNQSCIKNIHLNNIRKLGIAKMEHGASFDDKCHKDMILLDKIFDLYKKFKYTCNITLEVDELNYLDAKEAFKLKKLIESRYDIKHNVG